MSMSSIRTQNLRNFGAAVGFQENGPDKAANAQKKAIVLDPANSTPLTGTMVGKTETPNLFRRKDANTTKPRLQFLKSVLDEFHVHYERNATVGQLKALAKKELPKSVLDVMKLGDYDTIFKHPLSDYRVTTVLRAVANEKAARAAGLVAGEVMSAARGVGTDNLREFVRSRCVDKNFNEPSAILSTKNWGNLKDMVCDVLEAYRRESGCEVSDENFQELVGKTMGQSVYNQGSAFGSLSQFFESVKGFVRNCEGFPRDGSAMLLKTLHQAVSDSIAPMEETSEPKAVAKSVGKQGIKTPKELESFAKKLEDRIESKLNKRFGDDWAKWGKDEILIDEKGRSVTHDSLVSALNGMLPTTSDCKVELRNLEKKVLKGWILHCTDAILRNSDNQKGDRVLNDVLVAKLRNMTEETSFGAWFDENAPLATPKFSDCDKKALSTFKNLLCRGLQKWLVSVDHDEYKGLFSDKMCAAALKDAMVVM